MSMQKLRGIRNTGAYTAQRSTLEHLLRLEEIILRETTDSINIPNERARIAQQLKEYKEQNKINKPFGIQGIQHYLLATTEREMSWEKSKIRGIYTSALIQQVEEAFPIIIDMQGNEIDFLLHAINTPRHITINNTKGDKTGAYAGSHHGTAHLTINNTRGDYTGTSAGSDHGTAHLTINNTRGDFTGAGAGSDGGNAHITINNTKGNYTGAHAGSHHGTAHITITGTEGKGTGERAGTECGKAHLIINHTKGEHTGSYAGSREGNAHITINHTQGNYTGTNAGSDHGTAYLTITRTKGDWTGANAGIDNGKAIIVAYNNEGKDKFFRSQGIIISYNPYKPPRIEGVNFWKNWRIKKLIEQNAPPEDIMAYLRRCA